MRIKEIKIAEEKAKHPTPPAPKAPIQVAA
jgi:hypothetical protein